MDGGAGGPRPPIRRQRKTGDACADLPATRSLSVASNSSSDSGSAYSSSGNSHQPTDVLEDSPFDDSDDEEGSDDDDDDDTGSDLTHLRLTPLKPSSLSMQPTLLIAAAVKASPKSTSQNSSSASTLVREQSVSGVSRHHPQKSTTAPVSTTLSPKQKQNIQETQPEPQPDDVDPRRLPRPQPPALRCPALEQLLGGLLGPGAVDGDFMQNVDHYYDERNDDDDDDDSDWDDDDDGDMDPEMAALMQQARLIDRQLQREREHEQIKQQQQYFSNFIPDDDDDSESDDCNDCDPDMKQLMLDAHLIDLHTQLQSVRAHCRQDLSELSQLLLQFRHDQLEITRRQYAHRQQLAAELADRWFAARLSL